MAIASLFSKVMWEPPLHNNMEVDGGGACLGVSEHGKQATVDELDEELVECVELEPAGGGSSKTRGR
jgi:hypothetical protein